MRLIDAGAIRYRDLSDGKGLCFVVFLEDIKEMPTVDAVQVVRCKDCKYYPDGKDATMWTPCLEDIRLDGKWFCAYGERKDDADD